MRFNRQRSRHRVSFLSHRRAMGLLLYHPPDEPGAETPPHHHFSGHCTKRAAPIQHRVVGLDSSDERVGPGHSQGYPPNKDPKSAQGMTLVCFLKNFMWLFSRSPDVLAQTGFIRKSAKKALYLGKTPPLMHAG